MDLIPFSLGTERTVVKRDSFFAWVLGWKLIRAQSARKNNTDGNYFLLFPKEDLWSGVSRLTQIWKIKRHEKGLTTGQSVSLAKYSSDLIRRVKGVNPYKTTEPAFFFEKSLVGTGFLPLMLASGQEAKLTVGIN